MFDIGFAELLVVAILGLIVLGPERLPQAVRTLALWIGRFKRSFSALRTEIEREVGADEIRRQLHNEALMAELKRGQEMVNRPLDLESIETVAADARPAVTPTPMPKTPPPSDIAGGEGLGQEPPAATNKPSSAKR